MLIILIKLVKLDGAPDRYFFVQLQPLEFIALIQLKLENLNLSLLAICWLILNKAESNFTSIVDLAKDGAIEQSSGLLKEINEAVDRIILVSNLITEANA